MFLPKQTDFEFLLPQSRKFLYVSLPCLGMHKTLPREVARESQVHCSEEPKAACGSIVPDP